jgi:methenyltetrahydromethanopterin cyclohydrolase
MTDNIKEPVYDENEILDPIDLIKAQSTDAKLWAKSFIDAMNENDWQLYDIDEQLMLGWFAAAIEATRDRIHNDNNKLLAKEVHNGYTDNKYTALLEEK